MCSPKWFDRTEFEEVLVGDTTVIIFFFKKKETKER